MEGENQLNNNRFAFCLLKSKGDTTKEVQERLKQEGIQYTTRAINKIYSQYKERGTSISNRQNNGDILSQSYLFGGTIWFYMLYHQFMEIEESQTYQNQAKRLEYSERLKIIGFYECCQSQQETADHFQVHQSTISRLLQKFQITGDVKDYRRSGRYNKLGAKEESKIEEMIDENKYITAQEVADTLKVDRVTALSKMHEIGMKFSIPQKIPQLNASHLQKRYDHCRQLKDQPMDNIIFTDESYFQLYRNTLGNWHFEQSSNYVCIPQSKVCLMVYGCISLKGKSEIYIYEKGFKVDSVAYCNVLDEILIPFATKQFSEKQKGKQVFTQWYLLQDNAPSHRSKVTQAFLKANQIQKLSHPPNSPDLNPIELVWALIKREVEKQQPKNQESLRQSILSSWESISQDHIISFIDHFKYRVQFFNLVDMQQLFNPTIFKYTSGQFQRFF
ncbi:hypothetical protein ABPG72_021744 [Tetrahymena utriculariae]